MNSYPVRRSQWAVARKKQRQQTEAILKEATESGAKAQVEAVEDAGAEKERGTLNEDSGRQHSSSGFRNHDVPGTGGAGGFFIPHTRRRPDAEDRSTQRQRSGLASRRQR